MSESSDGDVQPAEAGMAVSSMGTATRHPAAFASFTRNVDALARATSNGVTLDPESADALINSLKAGLNRATEAVNALTRAQVDNLPLGSSPAAELYKPTFARVSNDPTQGGNAAYRQLEKDIQRAIETVQACVRTTQANEENSATGLRDVESC